METERDVIAWVANNNEFAPNVPVTYQGKTIKTNTTYNSVLATKCSISPNCFHLS